ncbi:arsenate reductase (glutaredoxin) [Comamonas aquatilis]|uniref:arsenate reductase (glutaredoxin) n=1 Tax=Comamonas aquatilis TaxID=1778406 RepID=UPI0039EF3525
MTTSHPTDAPVNRPDITIFHNNRCSNSRGALALLRDNGIEPNIVDYLATPLTAPELAELVAHLGVPLQDLLRTKEAAYQELGLDQAGVSDAQRLAAVAAHPVLLNRPIVVTPKGAALCRPPEKVLALI